MAFWEKSRFLWVQMFASIFQKGFYRGAMSWLCNHHSCHSSHWNFFILKLKISHWLVWVPGSSSAFLLCYSVHVNIPPLALLPFYLHHTSTTLYTDTDASIVHTRVPIKQSTNKQNTYWLIFCVDKIICISSCPGRNTGIYKILTCHHEHPYQNGTIIDFYVNFEINVFCFIQ